MIKKQSGLKLSICQCYPASWFHKTVCRNVDIKQQINEAIYSISGSLSHKSLRITDLHDCICICHTQFFLWCVIHLHLYLLISRVSFVLIFTNLNFITIVIDMTVKDQCRLDNTQERTINEWNIVYTDCVHEAT